MARKIGVVIDALLEVIPETENVLRRDIINYGQSLWNIAPEMLSNREYFIDVQRILASNVPVIDTPWKIEAQKIFNDEK